ncbi:hypothetical protein GGE09_000969 [Roseobacter sp. N2S]|nr:hypothetical protein [Roseobacter sp. N2S]
MSKHKDLKSINFDFKSKEFDRNKYFSVSKDAKLLEIFMTESHFRIKDDCMGELLTEGDLLKHAFDGSWNNVSFDTVNGILVGSYLWQVKVKSGRKDALKLSTKYVVAYENLLHHEEKYVELYFKKVARFATYPYFRSQFAIQSHSAGLKLPPLPSLSERVD